MLTASAPGSAAAGEFVLDDSVDCCVEDAVSAEELVVVAPSGGSADEADQEQEGPRVSGSGSATGSHAGVTTRSSSVSSRRSRRRSRLPNRPRCVAGIEAGVSVTPVPRHVAARGESSASAAARRATAPGTRERTEVARGAPRKALPSDGVHRTATHAGATAGTLRSTDDAASPLRDRCNARTRRATVNQTRESRTFSAAKPRT